MLRRKATRLTLMLCQQIQPMRQHQAHNRYLVDCKDLASGTRRILARRTRVGADKSVRNDQEPANREVKAKQKPRFKWYRRILTNLRWYIRSIAQPRDLMSKCSMLDPNNIISWTTVNTTPLRMTIGKQSPRTRCLISCKVWSRTIKNISTRTQTLKKWLRLSANFLYRWLTKMETCQLHMIVRLTSTSWWMNWLPLIWTINLVSEAVTTKGWKVCLKGRNH